MVSRFCLTLIFFVNTSFGKPITDDTNLAPKLVLVPPQVILQTNQTEVEVNCSVLADQQALIKWFLISTSDDRDDPVTVIDSHSSAQINDCVTANTSEKVIDSNQSQVTLYLKLASENCIKNIQDGRLYLRGVCMASNSYGTTSETFVLGVMSPTNDFEEEQENEKQKYGMLRHNNHYHLTSTWTGSPDQVSRYRRDLLWMFGVSLGLVTPVCVGVFIVFNLTCMRNASIGYAGTMFGAANAEMMQCSTSSTTAYGNSMNDFQLPPPTWSTPSGQ